jgi:CRISPR-associated protein Csh2
MNDADILFLYDAKLTNPNGDPDEENRPRMDEATGRNLVSDVRLKRYMRDYWLERGHDVWVRKVDGQTVDAKGRIEGLLNEYLKEQGITKKPKHQEAAKDPQFGAWLTKRLVDLRFFGATIPMQEASMTFTGPVQFAWGHSLHRVEINASATISSTFAGRDAKSDHGTFGKDWRVYYSLIGFYGIVSAGRAKHTGLSEDDLALFDRTMLEAIVDQATSRSKIGQTPRLYLRVVYANAPEDGALLSDRRLGDMRRMLKVRPHDGDEDSLRDVNNYALEVDALVEAIAKRASAIDEVIVYQHPDLTTISPKTLEIGLAEAGVKVRQV